MNKYCTKVMHNVYWRHIRQCYSMVIIISRKSKKSVYFGKYSFLPWLLKVILMNSFVVVFVRIYIISNAVSLYYKPIFITFSVNDGFLPSI